MSSERRNLPASIHQRLLNKAHETGQVFNELLQYYAIERLLYRLSVSDHSGEFILKGALMLNAWGLANTRPTRDIDLLGPTVNTLSHVVNIFQGICGLKVEPDGLEFDADHIQGERITEDAEYEGIRITMTASLAKRDSPSKLTLALQM